MLAPAFGGSASAADQVAVKYDENADGYAERTRLKTGLAAGAVAMHTKEPQGRQVRITNARISVIPRRVG